MTSHHTGVCRPRSLWLLLLARFLDSAPRPLEAASSSERPPGAPGAHAWSSSLCLFCQRNLINRTQDSAQLLHSQVTEAAPVVPWRVAPSPPHPNLWPAFPQPGNKSLCSYKEAAQAQPCSPQTEEGQIILVSLEYLRNHFREVQGNRGDSHKQHSTSMIRN